MSGHPKDRVSQPCKGKGRGPGSTSQGEGLANSRNRMETGVRKGKVGGGDAREMGRG